MSRISIISQLLCSVWSRSRGTHNYGHGCATGDSTSFAERKQYLAESKMFSSMEIIDIPEKPFQPIHLVFPPHDFGQTSRTFRWFKRTWFNFHKWLHYDVGNDAAFSFICCEAAKAVVGAIAPQSELLCFASNVIICCMCCTVNVAFGLYM